MQKSMYVRRITVSALFLGVALALKPVSLALPLFGEYGKAIGISGIFSMMPSILFGPVYGAITSGLSDFMGYLINSKGGAYLPLMTLVVAGGGLLRGALWRVLRGRRSGSVRIAVGVVSLALLVFGLVNMALLHADGVSGAFYDGRAAGDIDTGGMSAIGRMLVTRTMNAKNPARDLQMYILYTTWGLIGSAAFGLVLLGIDMAVARFLLKDADQGQTMQLLVAVVVSGLVVTTVNTVILREQLYSSWKLMPFAVVWLPRLFEALLSNTIESYFVAMLLGVFKRQHSLGALVELSTPTRA